MSVSDQFLLLERQLQAQKDYPSYFLVFQYYLQTRRMVVTPVWSKCRFEQGWKIGDKEQLLTAKCTVLQDKNIVNSSSGI